MEKGWIVRTNDFKQGLIDGDVVRCNERELMLHAFKKLGIFWGIGLLSILIPVLHFFLVPTFFLLGIFFFVQALRFKNLVKVGSYDCPAFHAKNRIDDLWFRETVHVRCAQCATQLLVMKSSAVI